MLPLQPLGEDSSLPLPTSGSLRHSLSWVFCDSITPTSASVFIWPSFLCMSLCPNSLLSCHIRTPVIVRAKPKELILMQLLLQRSYFQIKLYSKVLEIRISTYLGGGGSVIIQPITSGQRRSFWGSDIWAKFHNDKQQLVWLWFRWRAF